MASVALHLKTHGILHSSLVPARPVATLHGAERSAFVRRTLKCSRKSQLVNSKVIWRTLRKRENLRAAASNPEDSSSVAVEDVVEDDLQPLGEKKVVVENVVGSATSPDDTSSVAVENVLEAATSPDDTSSSVAVEDDLQLSEQEGAVEHVVEDDFQLSEEQDVEVEDSVEDTQLSAEDEEDRQNIRDILRVLELLRTKRDMTFNEVRLTIMIEDPRDVERRKELNIEDERGCSKEEMGAALVEVYEGRLPQDKLTLRELAKEMLNWPNLEVEDEYGDAARTSPVASPYAKVTDTGVDPRVAAQRAKVDWDTAADIEPGEPKKELNEVLPPAMGFSLLYLVSAIPVIIGVTVVLILFFNSLQ